MGKRQREWAKKRRLELIVELGGKCAECGTTRKLEVDHVDGRDWEVRRKESSARVSKYWKEHREGVRLQVLCQECNGTDGAYRR
jgi:5-methylcytosine-specific restriction endonuclease McrA